MKRKSILFAMLLLAVLSLVLYGCKSGPGDAGSPQALLDKYFSSAVKQDYAGAYSCYYQAYKDKISQEDYIKHRKEASVLQSYKILSIQENGNTAKAKVTLTFAPSKKFNRNKPATVKVTEDLIKENGQWKIKVW